MHTSGEHAKRKKPGSESQVLRACFLFLTCRNVVVCINDFNVAGEYDRGGWPPEGRGTGGVYLDGGSKSDIACLVLKQVCICKVKTGIRLE